MSALFFTRQSPERKCFASHIPVQRFGDIEAVVSIVLTVGDPIFERLPEIPPRETAQSQTGSSAGRKSEWKVEADEETPATRELASGQVYDARRRLCTGWKILERGQGEAAGPPHRKAKPDTVMASGWRVRGAPVDHQV